MKRRHPAQRQVRADIGWRVLLIAVCWRSFRADPRSPDLAQPKRKLVAGNPSNRRRAGRAISNARDRRRQAREGRPDSRSGNCRRARRRRRSDGAQLIRESPAACARGLVSTAHQVRRAARVEAPALFVEGVSILWR
jgi:hypothetical protein